MTEQGSATRERNDTSSAHGQAGEIINTRDRVPIDG